jgi:hypothetical protein
MPRPAPSVSCSPARPVLRGVQQAPPAPLAATPRDPRNRLPGPPQGHPGRHQHRPPRADPARPHRRQRRRHAAPRRPAGPPRHRTNPRPNPRHPAHPGPPDPHHRRQHRRTVPRAHLDTTRDYQPQAKQPLNSVTAGSRVSDLLSVDEVAVQVGDEAADDAGAGVAAVGGGEVAVEAGAMAGLGAEDPLTAWWNHRPGLDDDTGSGSGSGSGNLHRTLYSPAYESCRGGADAHRCSQQARRVQARD